VLGVLANACLADAGFGDLLAQFVPLHPGGFEGFLDLLQASAMLVESLLLGEHILLRGFAFLEGRLELVRCDLHRFLDRGLPVVESLGLGLPELEVLLVLGDLAADAGKLLIVGIESLGQDFEATPPAGSRGTGRFAVFPGAIYLGLRGIESPFELLVTAFRLGYFGAELNDLRIDLFQLPIDLAELIGQGLLLGGQSMVPATQIVEASLRHSELLAPIGQHLLQRADLFFVLLG
jgi:hypothetical protein